MDPDQQRARLAALAEERGLSLALLSRVLGRNPAYLQQYLVRRSPRLLGERDRARLAEFLGVAEAELGGTAAAAALVPVPRLDLAASAGPGNWAEDEAALPNFAFPPALLRQWGVRPEAASMVRVQGDSMAPTLRHGDEILVDRDCRRVGAGIFVLRVDGELVVKRVRPAVGGIELVSDNPAYPPRVVRSAGFALLGRVAWLGRAL